MENIFLIIFRKTLMWFQYSVVYVFFLQVIGTICILFTLAPQLAPILGILMLTVSVLVGKHFLFQIIWLAINLSKENYKG